jgi:hypothetical protein
MLSIAHECTSNSPDTNSCFLHINKLIFFHNDFAEDEPTGLGIGWLYKNELSY